jgi:uncharacterized protein (UPF0332 family)
MKPETQSLLHKAHENREAAALLLQNGYADIAASRLYYAVFYTAEALLLERGQVFSSHSAVIAAFGRDFAKTGVLDPRFHRYLIDAQDLRQTGDYDTAAVVTPAQVEQALRWADDFLAAAQALLT